MFKKLICLLLPITCITAGFADEMIKGTLPPADIPIADNYYDPDKVVDGPIPHPSDVE